MELAVRFRVLLIFLTFLRKLYKGCKTVIKP